MGYHPPACQFSPGYHYYYLGTVSLLSLRYLLVQVSGRRVCMWGGVGRERAYTEVLYRYASRVRILPVRQSCLSPPSWLPSNLRHQEACWAQSTWEMKPSQCIQHILLQRSNHNTICCNVWITIQFKMIYLAFLFTNKTRKRKGKWQMMKNCQLQCNQ